MIGIGAIGEAWLPCPFLQSPSLLMLFLCWMYFTTVKPVRQLFERETLVSIVILVIEYGNCPLICSSSQDWPNVGGS
ncbi:hypothetical protein HanRHA438_Chr00c13g0849431 [Helianthus annuus]|uniref:Uncharacterized protein n=2 Tax=Helianthus annuus TaxID=4232 RepID=A0A9K3EKP9_HELAN|nr:hypothetical protein HanXRQr2_Chr13g0607891 [Helianthus annuus]KAJ0478272.1 hypothetical protein HanHA300_Chr13g0498351 [Helianthus annuus]KAJ0499156.1 hypothetical protein HanHA89_Chr13g0531021 [Helianthus annuus]KAJ0665170.1 hypothetical protein HanLR1_Chr13g0501051 [Helianthus annuus]KAJ0672585.1 hypothetical protein HanOQP8_Chr13g0498961 [Helianthus annuus]